MAGLGRGLGSLIPKKVNRVIATPDGEAVVSVTTDDDIKRIMELCPGSIRVNPYQPRKKFRQAQLEELMDSIQRHGIIQPLVVTQLSEGVYELIAGERRLRASQNLGLEKVPVVVRSADNQQKLELALIENIQRENLNPIETALAYRKLLDEFSINQEELSRRVGKSRPAVTNSLRLLSLPNDVQDGLVNENISEGHARLIAGLDTEDKQLHLFRQVIDNGLSVGATSEETRRMGGTKESRIKINYKDKEREFRLKDFFGTKVNIMRNSRGGGRINIEFLDEVDLERMMRLLG